MHVIDHLLDWYYGLFWLGNTLQRSDCYLYCEVESIAQFRREQGRHLSRADISPDPRDMLVPAHPGDITTRTSSRRGIRFCLISDTHDRHHLFPQLPPCDILVHSGDILMTGRLMSRHGAIRKLTAFNEWIGQQSARWRIVVGGNHDSVLEDLDISVVRSILCNAIYLCNSEVTIMGLCIFGSPLSFGYSKNRAFQSPRFAADTVTACRALSRPVDVLVTHGRCPSIGRIVQPSLLHITGHLHRLHGVELSSQPDEPDELTDKGHPLLLSSAPRVAPLMSWESLHRDNVSSGRIWLKASAPIMDPRYQPSQVPIVIDFTQLQRL
jgi:hypothetical protein